MKPLFVDSKRKNATTSNKIIVFASLVVVMMMFLIRKGPPVDGTTSCLRLPQDTSLSSHSFLTVGEMKQTMQLPCNYVHDGYYLTESNEILNQVYQSIQSLDDDIIPVLVECGGHDGITKSLSLKASVCLKMNTLLIEGSPTTFNILQQTRAYDRTVHAALCNEEYVYMSDNPINSGENGVTSVGSETSVKVPCTSIDDEMDRIRDLLPDAQKDKLKLIFLILDVEGHEPVAVKGIERYAPSKVFMEIKLLKPDQREQIFAWASQHELDHKSCGNDECFNFDPPIATNNDKRLFYGARHRIPENSFRTSEASKAYYHYGT